MNSGIVRHAVVPDCFLTGVCFGRAGCSGRARPSIINPPALRYLNIPAMPAAYLVTRVTPAFGWWRHLPPQTASMRVLTLADDRSDTRHRSRQTFSSLMFRYWSAVLTVRCWPFNCRHLTAKSLKADADDMVILDYQRTH